jgi:hypothetical protein
LAEAVADVNEAFPAVKAAIGAEGVEKTLEAAEKKLLRSLGAATALTAKQRARQTAKSSRGVHGELATTGTTASADPLAAVLTAAPKRKWMLSESERKTRESAATKAFDDEVASKLMDVQAELRPLEAEDHKFLAKQKNERRAEKAKKEKAKERDRAAARAERKKEESKVKAGLTRKIKQARVRKARLERRSDAKAEAKEKAMAAGKRVKRNKAGDKKTRGRYKKSRRK